VQNSRGGMVVTFILLNKTKLVRGDVEVTVYPEKGLMDALNALKNSVQSGQFKVEFQQEKIYATKSSFYVGFWPSSPLHSGSPLTTAKPSNQGGSKMKTEGVSSGAAAGISFLMLAVGICGGLLIAHVIMKRRGTSLFQYQRQE